MRKSLDIEDRLLSHILVDDNGCWNWTGSKNKQGYGSIGIGSRRTGERKTVKTHRLSYSLFVGINPEGYDICQNCDKPSCKNPAHLFAGSVLDNMADMDSKGRRGYSYSEDHPSAKLTEEDVFTARKLRRNGYSYYRLAKMYGVNRETMRQSVLGATWKHLKDRHPPEGEA